MFFDQAAQAFMEFIPTLVLMFVMWAVTYYLIELAVSYTYIQKYHNNTFHGEGHPHRTIVEKTRRFRKIANRTFAIGILGFTVLMVGFSSYNTVTVDPLAREQPDTIFNHFQPEIIDVENMELREVRGAPEVGSEERAREIDEKFNEWRDENRER